MEGKKICPHCGGTVFMGAITRACIVEVFASDKEGKESFNVSKETKDKYSIDIVKCIHCKRDISKDDLVTGIKCKECGKITLSSDLNQDGICSVCEAKKNRAELANASQDDLIRMLLEAEKKNNSISEKISKKIDNAEKVTSTLSDNTDNVTDDKESESDTKKRAKAPRNKKKNVNETEIENSDNLSTENGINEQPVENANENIKEAVNDIVNSQEAPFPDFPGMNAPESTVTTSTDISSELAEPTDENVSKSTINEPEPFQLFDENEEPF